MTKTTKLPIPVGKKLLLEIKETSAGGISVHQGAQIQELGTVLAVGEFVNGIKKGDVIHFKAWAIDCITVDGEKYYYLDSDSTAICGIVK